MLQGPLHGEPIHIGVRDRETETGHRLSCGLSGARLEMIIVTSINNMPADQKSLTAVVRFVCHP